MARNGKRALVTGASMGIGADLARLLAARGYDLVLVARSRERLEALAQELAGAYGVEVRVEAVDLTDAIARHALADDLHHDNVVVDVLINNAGFGSNGSFIALPRDRELGQIDLNISALVDLTHRFLGPMVQRGSGRVLNIASTAGFQPGPWMATYYATKAFVISFTESLAEELRGTGVTITAHCPGATATEFASTAGNGNSLLFKTPGAVATSMDVARHALAAMDSGRPIVIHGAMNTFVAKGVPFTPRALVRRLSARLNRP